jgi:hypothetical protein
MRVLRVILIVAWLLVIGVSIHAIQAMGASASGNIFLGDFSHPWRAQFNTDFSFHLLLMALWILYREKSPIRGFAFALLSIVGGGAFSLAYIFVATFAAKGDIRRLLLGDRAAFST